jgi:hypothetical protein
LKPIEKLFNLQVCITNQSSQAIRRKKLGDFFSHVGNPSREGFVVNTDVVPRSLTFFLGLGAPGFGGFTSNLKLCNLVLQSIILF